MVWARDEKIGGLFRKMTMGIEEGGRRSEKKRRKRFMDNVIAGLKKRQSGRKRTTEWHGSKCCINAS